MAMNTDAYNMSFAKRPLFPFAAAVVMGILVSERVGLAPTAAVIFILTVAGLILSEKMRKASLPALLVLATFLASAVYYQIYTRIAPDDVSHFAGQGPITIHGTVVEDAEVAGETARLKVRALVVEQRGEVFQTSGRLLCSVYGTASERDALPKYGSQVQLQGELTEPTEPTNPGRFSYRTYLARQRIYATMYVRYPYQLKIMEVRKGNAFISSAGATRRRIAKSLDRLMPQPESGVAAGMALGTYSTLPDSVFTAFSRTGTLHLLAASGFNCAVIFGFTLLVLKLLRAPRRSSYLVAVVPLLFYMYIVGVKPSIFRATKVAALVSGSKFLGRIADPLNILFAALIIILAYRPTDLFDVGFQLSFAAVLAIIVILPIAQPVFDRMFQHNPAPSAASRVGLRLGRTLCEAVTMTFAATLGTLPITAHYFNYVSIVALPVNAAVALMVPAVFLLSLATPVVDVIPYVGQLTAALATIVVRLMLLIVNAFAAPEWSSVAVGSPGFLGSSGYYLAVGAIVAYRAKRQ